MKKNTIFILLLAISSQANAIIINNEKDIADLANTSYEYLIKNNDLKKTEIKKYEFESNFDLDTNWRIKNNTFDLSSSSVSDSQMINGIGASFSQKNKKGITYFGDFNIESHTLVDNKLIGHQNKIGMKASLLKNIYGTSDRMKGKLIDIEESLLKYSKEETTKNISSNIFLMVSQEKYLRKTRDIYKQSIKNDEEKLKILKEKLEDNLIEEEDYLIFKNLIANKRMQLLSIKEELENLNINLNSISINLVSINPNNNIYDNLLSKAETCKVNEINTKNSLKYDIFKKQSQADATNEFLYLIDKIPGDITFSTGLLTSGLDYLDKGFFVELNFNYKFGNNLRKASRQKSIYESFNHTLQREKLLRSLEKSKNDYSKSINSYIEKIRNLHYREGNQEEIITLLEEKYENKMIEISYLLTEKNKLLDIELQIVNEEFSLIKSFLEVKNNFDFSCGGIK